jgi:hypothetical protein
LLKKRNETNIVGVKMEALAAMKMKFCVFCVFWWRCTEVSEELPAPTASDIGIKQSFYFIVLYFFPFARMRFFLDWGEGAQKRRSEILLCFHRFYQPSAKFNTGCLEENWTVDLRLLLQIWMLVMGLSVGQFRRYVMVLSYVMTVFMCGVADRDSGSIWHV